MITHIKRQLRGKDVVVVGLRRSGLAAAELLHHLGAYVGVTEKEKDAQILQNAKRLRQLRIKVELGAHRPDFIKGKHLLVASPGVPDEAPPLIWARQAGIPVIGEMELGYSSCPARIIAITGTNGKSSVCMLIAQLLRARGMRVFVLGNIGNPLCSEVLKLKRKDLVCLEVSSFQLERIERFRPYVAVILNFSPDHLDRHQSLNDYFRAKKRIFLNQDKDDFTVLNFEQPQLRDLAKETKAKVIYFSNSQRGDRKVNANYSAAIAVGSIFGINRKEALLSLKNFRALPHRLEYVDTLKGIEFIDDSKATNLHSTLWALKNIAKPIVLIAGGRDKGQSFQEVDEIFKGRLKRVILIGEAKQRLKSVLGERFALDEAEGLAQAVEIAYKRANRGDCVLLSPMCASFDMFRDFRERGEVFKKAVKALKSKIQ